MPELTIIERAQKALSIEHTETSLKKMAGKTSDIKEIKDNADYNLVKSSRISIKGIRIDIQKAGKTARDDANKFSKAVIGEEKRLIGIISPEESRLQALQDEVDQKIYRETSARIQAEKDRIQAIMDRMQGIEDLADGLLGKDSGEIKSRIDFANSISCDETGFAEYLEQAMHTKTETSKILNDAYRQRRDFEDQQAEQARIAEKQAERQAEIDKQSAEIKAQQDKIDANHRQQQAEKLAAERAEAEKVRLEKERLEQEDAERIQKEETARMQAEDEARQEALRPDKDRLIDWLKKLRFIDGVELHDKKLIAIQLRTLTDLTQLSKAMVKVVEDV